MSYLNTGKTLGTSLRKEAGKSAGNSTVLSSLPLRLNMDEVSVEYVKDLVVSQRKTHSEISLLLKEAYPGRRGLSLRSVRRFCFKNGIHAQNRLSNDELEQCTKEVVARVGMLELFVLFFLKKNLLFYLLVSLHGL